MLLVQAQVNEQPETPRFDALVPGFGQTRADFSEHVFRPQRREFAQVRWTREARSPLADSLDLQIGAQRIVDDRVTRDFGSPNREIEHNASTLLGLIGHFAKRLGADHSLSYGFEVYHDTVESERTRERLVDGALSVRPGRFPDGSTMRWTGVYATDRWTPNERIDVTAGARYTRYDIDLSPTINDTGVHLAPDDVSANVGVVFHLSETINLVSNLGHGFRPPNVFDLGTFGARGNRFSIPNEALSPERVTSFDAGLKYADARVSAELIGFESRYADKITQVLTGDVDPAGRSIVQSRNATRLTMRGVEAGATWRMAAHARLRVSATWTRGDEQLAGDSYAADRIPPLFGHFALRVGSEAWSIEPSIHWATSQRRLSPRDAVDPRMNPDGTDGWICAGLRARWAPGDAFALQAGVENLADRRYREHGSGYDAPGRNAFVSANFSF
jgi:outer membrane receptor protein involved in Fe transport